MVKGLTFEMCQKGKMTQDVHIEFVQAVKYLEEKKVCAITGDCAPLLCPSARYLSLIHISEPTRPY